MSLEPNLTLFVRVDVRFPELCEFLDEQPGIAPAPPSYYHITLKTIGEYSDDLDAVIPLLEDQIAGFEAFEVPLSGVATFPDCVYVPVDDEAGRLTEIHEAIRNIGVFDNGAFEGEEYIPHVTVGRLVGEEADESLDGLSEFQDVDWGTVYVEAVHLVQDGTDSVGPYTTFESIAEFDLD